ncbi:hypothetical protein [Blastochloris tepida]|uniref:Uncharacterized protein n=1 Tax=Blastochloris tepida TaxID=2233851 RepID=A0A348FYS4_9HYPH|nr:hypothetical protein [Blastochloris tepida]BBF92457.1 hypothetical protein BLTE_11420 [Blastochloris tepida]
MPPSDATPLKSGRRHPSHDRAEPEIRRAEQLYRAFVFALCKANGVSSDAVLASDPRSYDRGRSAYPLGQIRLQARYLTVVEGRFKQAVVAAACGVTEVAVCLGLKRVEDMRDDRAIENLMDLVAEEVLGTLCRTVAPSRDILFSAARAQIGA